MGSVLVSSWETWSPVMKRVRPSAWLVAMLCSGWCYSKETTKNPKSYCNTFIRETGFLSVLQRVSLSSQVGGNFQGTPNFPLQRGQTWRDGGREPFPKAPASPRQPPLSFHQASPAVAPRRWSEMISSQNREQPRAWSLPITEKPV